LSTIALLTPTALKERLEVYVGRAEYYLRLFELSNVEGGILCAHGERTIVVKSETVVAQDVWQSEQCESVLPTVVTQTFHDPLTLGTRQLPSDFYRWSLCLRILAK